MIVRVVAVVLRLAALYVLWWGMRASVQMLAFRGDPETVRIVVVTLVLSLAVAAVLWIFAKSLAAILYPYEADEKAALTLDIDRLEIFAVQFAGVILIVSALLDVITVLHRIVLALTVAGTGPVFGEFLADDGWLVASAVKALLTGLLGLVLIVRVDGLRALLRRLRRAG